MSIQFGNSDIDINKIQQYPIYIIGVSDDGKTPSLDNFPQGESYDFSYYVQGSGYPMNQTLTLSCYANSYDDILNVPINFTETGNQKIYYAHDKWYYKINKTNYSTESVLICGTDSVEYSGSSYDLPIVDNIFQLDPSGIEKDTNVLYYFPYKCPTSDIRPLVYGPDDEANNTDSPYIYPFTLSNPNDAKNTTENFPGQLVKADQCRWCARLGFYILYKIGPELDDHLKNIASILLSSINAQYQTYVNSNGVPSSKNLNLGLAVDNVNCLLYTSPSPRDLP